MLCFRFRMGLVLAMLLAATSLAQAQQWGPKLVPVPTTPTYGYFRPASSAYSSSPNGAYIPSFYQPKPAVYTKGYVRQDGTFVPRDYRFYLKKSKSDDTDD